MGSCFRSAYILLTYQELATFLPLFADSSGLSECIVLTLFLIISSFQRRKDTTVIDLDYTLVIWIATQFTYIEVM